MGTHMPLARYPAQILFDLDLGLAVRADALQLVVLEKWVVVGDAVNCRRGDMDHALDALFIGGLEHVAAAVDVGRINVLRRIQGQCRGRVHDHVHALHGALDRRQIANVALDLRDAAALGIGKVRQVERDDVVPTRQQMARQVNA